MKKWGKILGVLVLLGGISGCSDGWDALIRDWDVWINEVCDMVLLVTDDASAKSMLDGPCRLLATKIEGLRDRTEKRVMSMQQTRDKEEMQALENAALDFHSESRSSLKRFKNVMSRLDEIIAGTSENENLKKLRRFEWGSGGKIDFLGTPLDFDIAKGDKSKDGGVLLPPPRKKDKKMGVGS